MLQTNNCDQMCINSVGSFTCGCQDGFTLDSDGFTCDREYNVMMEAASTCNDEQDEQNLSDTAD